MALLASTCRADSKRSHFDFQDSSHETKCWMGLHFLLSVPRQMAYRGMGPMLHWVEETLAEAQSPAQFCWPVGCYNI